MAIKVADANSSAKKYAQRGAAAATDYAKGVTGAGGDWQSKTAASVETYNAGVQESIARGAFAKGVNASGGAKYEKNASTVGAQRYPQGVQNGAGEWETKTAPYLQTISGLTLPPRRPKGDPGNLQRVAAVTQALRARKVGG